MRHSPVSLKSMNSLESRFVSSSMMSSRSWYWSSSAAESLRFLLLFLE